MTCPKCGKDTSVIDSYPMSGSIKRRRKCQECGYRFSTLELAITDELSDRIGSRNLAQDRVDSSNRRQSIRRKKPGPSAERV